MVVGADSKQIVQSVAAEVALGFLGQAAMRVAVVLEVLALTMVAPGQQVLHRQVHQFKVAAQAVAVVDLVALVVLAAQRHSGLEAAVVLVQKLALPLILAERLAEHLVLLLVDQPVLPVAQ